MWSRIGNFYNEFYYPGSRLKHLVEFIPGSFFAPITRMVMEDYNDRGLLLTLNISSFCQDEINDISKPLKINVKSIPLNSVESWENLMELFNKINRHYDTNYISIDILTDLQEIFNFTQKHLPYRGKHMLSEIHYAECYEDPKKANSKELLELVDFKEDITLKKVLALLIHGENPNQMNWRGDTPLKRVVMHGFLEVAEFLLIYGAYPRRDRNGISPLDLAREYNDFAFLNMFIKHFSKAKPSINHTLLVTNIDVSLNSDGEVKTTVQYNNNLVITSTLKKAHELFDEKNELFSIFKEIFVSLNIIESFATALKGNTYVDLIRVNGKLIGFVIQEILRLQDTEVYNIKYASIHPDYRRYKIPTLFAFRLACSALLLTQIKKIAVYFSAVSPDSFNMVSAFLFFPKHQSGHVKKTVKNILDHEHGSSLNYVNDEAGVCYVEEKEQTTERNPTSNENNKLYWYMRANQNKVGIPTLLFIDKTSLDKLMTMFSSININFLEHLFELAPILHKFYLPELPTLFSTSFTLASCRHLFFNNKIIINNNESFLEEKNQTTIKAKL